MAGFVTAMLEHGSVKTSERLLYPADVYGFGNCVTEAGVPLVFYCISEISVAIHAVDRSLQTGVLGGLGSLVLPPVSVIRPTEMMSA